MKRLLVLAIVCSLPRPASACGGFFCDQGGGPGQPVPVAQAGEEILFVADGNSVEVHVRIKYQGSAAAFAWILPVRAVPTLSVGVDATFLVLDQFTTPQFPVSRQSLGCGNGAASGGGIGCAADDAAASGGSGGTGGSGGAGGDGVDVISHGAVGPYESVVLQADDGAALRAWLTNNGYQLSPTGSALLDPYVMEHDYFVALKLRADATASDIQPIVLRFAGNEPCVPLRLTAIAALDDMDVTVFLLGSARAVPTNFYEVIPNWAALDWTQPGATYRSLVSAAVDEAGGRAFVTEYAGSSSIMSGKLWTPNRYDLTQMRAARDAYEFLNAFLYMFPLTPQTISMLQHWIPEPQAAINAGIPAGQFYNCPSCYASYLQGVPVDANAASDDFAMRVVTPLQQAQQLFDRMPWLTRVYTQISPPEMTADPTFAFNPSLPAVSNMNQAAARIGCYDNGSQPIEWMLPDGTVVKTNGANRGWLANIPAATEWRQMSATGPGVVIGDNSAKITTIVDTQNRAVPDPKPLDNQSFGCGCRVATRQAAAMLPITLLALALGLIFRPRRR